MADVSWNSTVRSAGALKLDASGVHGPEWQSAIANAIRDLNALFTANSLSVSLTTGHPAQVPVALSSGPYSFTYDGTSYSGALRTDILHGVTRGIDIQLGSNTSRDRAFIFLPQSPRVNPQLATSRLVGEPVMRVIIAHEFLHALGLDAHDPAFEGLFAGSWTLNRGIHPAQDTVTPFGRSATLPPLALSQNTITRLAAIW